MLQTLVKHQALFTKPQYQPSSRILCGVGLKNDQFVFVSQFGTIFHCKLQDSKCSTLSHIKLPGKPYHLNAINQNILVVSLVDSKSIQLVNLKEKKVFRIFKFPVQTIYNVNRQSQRFFQSTVGVFLETQSFYIKQQLYQSKTLRLIYFQNTGNQELFRQPQVIEHPLKNICTQLDQKQKLVRFTQEPEINGSFTFTQIDLKNKKTFQVTVQNASFVLYATIVDIKAINSEKYALCLNSKQGKHQMIIFTRNETLFIWQNSKIFIQSLLINPKLNYGLFSFLYGKQNISTETVTLVNFDERKIINSIQIDSHQLLSNLEYNQLLNFSREYAPTEALKFDTLHIVPKPVNSMKLLEGLGLTQNGGPQFMMQILKMLY